MDVLKKFVTATIVGGLLFLIPIAIVLVVLGQALTFAHKLAQPIATYFPDSGIAGVGAATLIAVLLLLLVSFGAGLFANTATGKRIMQWFEDSLFGRLPQYQMMKSMMLGMAQLENDGAISPILVNVEDAWQIGYQLESIDDEWVVAFLPQAPTPMSGNLMYLPRNRVRPLNITMVQATGLIKRMGVGSGKALRGVDLSLPAGQ